MNILQNRPDRAFGASLVVILLVAGALRLYRLGDYPQLFNQDQAVLGYDAWSLWQTGRDHHGDILPIYFRTYSDYVPPVANYLTAPFVGLLGLDEFSTRLPFALMGVASVLLIGLTARRWFGPLAGIVAAVLLAIDPWALSFSRTAFPASCVPFFTILALYAFTRALDLLKALPAARQAPLIGWLTLSGVAFGLLTDCFPIMKIHGPLLVAICILAALPTLWKHRWFAAYWLFVYAFCVNPLVILQILEWNQVQNRFNSISGLARPYWLLQASRLYAEHFNPSNLFFAGFRGGVNDPPLGVGELFWLEGPLWIAAFVGLVKGRYVRTLGFSVLIVLCLWFVTYPLADSLTEGDHATSTQLGNAHETHSIDFLPLPELLAAYGATIIWQALSRYRLGPIRASGLAVAASAIVLGLFLLYYIPYFFGPPLIDGSGQVSEDGYTIGLRPLLAEAASVATPCDAIWLQDTNETYMYYLFLTRYPPQRFQQIAVQQFGYDVIYFRQLGRVNFGKPEFANPYNGLTSGCAGQPFRVYFLGRYPSSVPSNWRLLDATRNQSGVVIWGLFETPPADTPTVPARCLTAGSCF